MPRLAGVNWEKANPASPSTTLESSHCSGGVTNPSPQSGTRSPHVALQVAVFGVPDEKYGEEICVWIQPREGTTLTADEVRAWVKKGMAHYKVPGIGLALIERGEITARGSSAGA